MAYTRYIKNVFLILLLANVFHGRDSFSDTAERQNGLKVITPSSHEEESKWATGFVNFGDEFLKYNIGFWCFKQVGAVTLQCKRDNNTITITVDGCTAGFIDKITHRHNIYKSTIIFDKDTKRLKPLCSYEKKIKGDKERVEIVHYDYTKNVCKYTIWRNGTFRREKEISFGNVSTDDGITAFYNLRSGAYGRVRDGAVFTIQNVHKGRSSESNISVRSIKDSDDLSRWRTTLSGAELMAEITLHPEAIDS